MPDVLDSERPALLGGEEATPESLQDRAQRVENALHRACGYGQVLWRELDTLRRYLFEDVAQGRRGEGTASLLRSTDQWSTWAERFASASSVLSGPAGDSGAGETAARLQAREHGVELPPPTTSPEPV